MKYILLFILGTISLSARAQWYHISFKPKKPPERLSVSQTPKHSIARLPVARPDTGLKIYPVQITHNEYSLEAAEFIAMKTAQRNMRLAIYNDASYNFSDLARLYMKQNRLSEAKWYLLQSNAISRQQNDDKHTVANLIDLATVKANLGDYTQAQQDLNEAHSIAGVRGFDDDLATIEKKLLYIKQNKAIAQKN